MEFEDQVEEATTFDPSEAPDGERLDGSETHRQRYERHADANTLRWNGAWLDKKRDAAAGRSAILDSIAARLDLTDYQKRRADEVNDVITEEITQGYEAGLVSLAICMIVGQEDGREYHPNNVHPNADDNHLKEVMEDAGFSYKQLYSCWESVRGEL